MLKQNRLVFATAILMALITLTACSAGDPTVEEVTNEAAAAIKAFASGKNTYEPTNKKISVTANIDQLCDQQSGQQIKIVRIHASNLTPKKRAIMFNANVSADMLSTDNKDSALNMLILQEAFAGITTCAAEYDKKSTEASKVNNPLVDSKEADSGCRWNGLTYNDQPAVDISSVKYPGVFLRLVQVRENKYTQK
jgi:hypothetical protein